MLFRAEGIQDVGGTTFIEWAFAKRLEFVIGSLVSEKLIKPPPELIKLGGVLATPQARLSE